MTADPLGGRFVAGDPLRGIACLTIVVYHVVVYAIGPTTAAVYDQVLGAGPSLVVRNVFLAVFVFFALSGYLIARPFIAAYVEDRRRPALKPYVARRFMRVVPMFWFAVLATLVVHGARGSSVGEVLAVPLFVQTYVPSEFAQRLEQGWSVGTEIFFYLWIPVVAWLAARCTPRRVGRNGRVAVVLAGASLVLVVGLALRARVPAGPFVPHAVLWSFAPGIALAALELVVPAWLRARPRVARRLSGALLAGLVLAFLVHLTIPVERVARQAAVEAVIAGCALAAPLVRQWAGIGAWRWLDWRPWHWAGERSYSIYLGHVLVLGAIAGGLRQEDPRRTIVLVLAVGLPATFLAAAGTYRWIERPGMRLGARVRSSSR